MPARTWTQIRSPMLGSHVTLTLGFSRRRSLPRDMGKELQNGIGIVDSLVLA